MNYIILFIYQQQSPEEDARRQDQKHHGSDDGNDGEICQQFGGYCHRAHASIVRGENENRRFAASHVAAIGGREIDHGTGRRAGFL